MATTPLAEKSDVEARLRRELTEPEGEWLDGILEEASLLVVAFCGREFDVEVGVPDAVRVVTSRVAARGVAAITAAQSGRDDLPNVVGPFQWAASTSGRLTADDRRLLARWRVASHVTSLDTR